MRADQAREQFINEICYQFQNLSKETVSALVSENMISPFTINLPIQILIQAQAFVRAAFTLRELPSYRAYLASEAKKHNISDPGNKSICMSYDFHVTQEAELKLIEINTNASFLALGNLLYQARKIPGPIEDFNFAEIKNNILEELCLNGKDINSPKIAIIDEKPQEQRLFLEFLVFQELFKNWNWSTKILDIQENLDGFDFIYNRYTDFYFSSASSKILLEKFNNRDVCFSPSPYEYLLLADKSRMIEWSQEGFFEKLGLNSENCQSLRKNLLISKIVNKINAEEVWTSRKNLFFKPKQSYGAKQTYRGAKISRKVFDEIVDQEFLAQEFAEAPELGFKTPEGEQKFKYDLRFYTYKDRIQSVIARVYQGQVTNLKTPYGGFACIEFTKS